MTLLARSLCTLAVTLVLVGNTRAQDWDLFPLGQRSWFHDQVNPSSEEVRMRLMDSIKTNGPEEVQYFRKQLAVQGAGPCSAQVLALIYPGSGADPIDSLVQRGDTVFYLYGGVAEPFYFLPRAAVGQQWTITSSHSANDYSDITITCTGIALETFLGVADSVRTFSMSADGSSQGQVPVSDFTMRLSRTYGLLEHVPFQLFLVHPPYVDFRSTALIGFESDGSVHGFHPPGFDDFFHPQVGDVLLWEDHFDPGWIGVQPWTAYHRDSTTAVLSYPDSMIVFFDRMVWHPDLTIVAQPGLSRTITRAGFVSLVECPDHWAAVANNDLTEPMPTGYSTVWSTGAMAISTEISLDTVVTVTVSTQYGSIDTTTCVPSEAFDVGEDLWFDTRAGLIKYCHWSSPSVTCSTLIGSLINGVPDGSIALSMPHEPTGREEGPQVHPNPAADLLFAKGVQAGTRYELRNMLGDLLRSGTLPSTGIDLVGLSPGIYVVRFETPQGAVSRPFIKR